MRFYLQLIFFIFYASCNFEEAYLSDNSSKSNSELIEVPIYFEKKEYEGSSTEATNMLLLNDLSHEIKIYDCISFNKGEYKIVKSDIYQSRGSINLFKGDTNCKSELLKFREDGQWYTLAPDDEQFPGNNEFLIYTTQELPQGERKKFYIQNLSSLDHIGPFNTSISFAVWKSFSKNLEEKSISVNKEISTQSSFLENLNLPRFRLDDVNIISDAQSIDVIFVLTCLNNPNPIYCGDTRNNLENISFFIFDRKPEKEYFSIQEIIDKLQIQSRDHDMSLIGSLEAYKTSVDKTSLKWTIFFDIENSLLYEGSNALVLVVATRDKYNPDDFYSMSFRYHLINLEYHNLD